MIHLAKGSPSATLMKGVTLSHCEEHMHLSFSEPRQALSSAVYGGGLKEVKQVLNMKVPSVKSESFDFEHPSKTLQFYADRHHWEGPMLGMMTAASMNSLRIAKVEEQGIEIITLVTSGIENARCAGDKAEYRLMGQQANEVGTINLIAITNAQMTPAAMAEAIMIITEAKTSALLQNSIKSPVSNKFATGTGTDSVAVVNGLGSTKISYCGKHVIFGELLARCVIESLDKSLNYKSPLLGSDPGQEEQLFKVKSGGVDA